MFRTWCSQLPLRSPSGPQLITFPLRSCGYDFHILQSRDLRHVPLIVTLVTFSHLPLESGNSCCSNMIPMSASSKAQWTQHIYSTIFGEGTTSLSNKCGKPSQTHVYMWDVSFLFFFFFFFLFPSHFLLSFSFFLSFLANHTRTRRPCRRPRSADGICVL